MASSRKVEVAARRRSRILNASLYTLLVAIILGLVGWINQAYIADQWRWWSVTRPYAGVNVWPYVLKTAKEQLLKPGDSFRECKSDCPEMVVVPAGSFTMGSSPAGKDSSNVEGPQHTVTFAKPIAVSKYELTFADWNACVAGGGCDGYKPAGVNQIPVDKVNWYDAQSYVGWLSQVTGKAYRLLSEAEYEYATRAGTTTEYPWGDDLKPDGPSMANCNMCGSKWDNLIAPVGSFPPNKFGLSDMVNNVPEWTEDCFHPNYQGAPTNGSAWLADNGGDCARREVRGAIGSNYPMFLRSASRMTEAASERFNAIGMRVARTFDTR